MEKLVKVAPVYYVTGNHEWSSGHFHDLEKGLNSLGVHVMRNTHTELIIGNELIHILGIDDPSSLAEPFTEKDSTNKALKTALKGLDNDPTFKILLSHRPELIPIYAHYEIDIIFSGHAHGGQFRFPLVGGLFAPNQGVLPKYTSGTYTEGNSTLIANRGLGNSLSPQRIFNRPEIIATTLPVIK